MQRIASLAAPPAARLHGALPQRQRSIAVPRRSAAHPRQPVPWNGHLRTSHRVASASSGGAMASGQPDPIRTDTLPMTPRPMALPDTPGATPVDASTAEAAGAEPPSKSKLQRFKEFFTGTSADRAKLARLGMGAFAAYGIISNLNYGVALTIAWLGFVKLHGVSPLAAGQKGPFLAYYAGMWTIQNFARPLRLAGAVALAPTINTLLATISRRTGFSLGAAFGLFMVSMAATTCTLLFSALYLLGGFPRGIVPLA